MPFALRLERMAEKVTVARTWVWLVPIPELN